jgi:hypothetical protein
MFSIRKSALLGSVAICAGCVREPAERLCPDVEVGALVVSELRVAASRGGADGATWIELFNASAAEIDLLGIGVRVRRLDGGAEQRLLVRRELVVAAGGLVVLSQTGEGARPGYADYGFGGDVTAPFYATAEIAVESCERVVDRMSYGKLAADASYALGAWPPSASSNDEAAAWCADGDGDGDSAPGTPGERNPPCR